MNLILLYIKILILFVGETRKLKAVEYYQYYLPVEAFASPVIFFKIEVAKVSYGVYYGLKSLTHSSHVHVDLDHKPLPQFDGFFIFHMEIYSRYYTIVLK